MTFEEINKLPEGTCLKCRRVGYFEIGKLHFHEGFEAIFQTYNAAWTIQNTDLYTVATDEEAMLYKLESL